ncbi:MAG: hypothetical protein P8Y03_24555, partial [Anaerolineales bacterium]
GSDRVASAADVVTVCVVQGQDMSRPALQTVKGGIRLLPRKPGGSDGPNPPQEVVSVLVVRKQKTSRSAPTNGSLEGVLS